MSDWQQVNAEYLSVMVEWLRARLRQYIEPDKRASLQPTIDELTDSMTALANAPVPPALPRLRDQFHLTAFEFNVLQLCIAMEIDTQISQYCAQAHDSTNSPYPTFSLALVLFEDAAWQAIAPEGALRYWQLITLDEQLPQPVIARRLQTDERVVNYAKGLNTLSPRLSCVLQPIEFDDTYLPPSQQRVLDDILWHLDDRNAPKPVIQLLGIDDSSKQLIAHAAAIESGYHLYRLNTAQLPEVVCDMEQFIRLWQRESSLLPLALYLDVLDEKHAGVTQRFLERQSRLCFLGVRERWSALSLETVLFDVEKPTPLEQRHLWQRVLPDDDENVASIIAGQFNLNPVAIQKIGHSAQSPHQIWQACRQHTRPRLEHLAQRLDARAAWRDLVLPEYEKRVLGHIAAQVRLRGKVYDDWGYRERMNRGFGISVLFSGDSGTGKTMAAEVIATELQLDLYRIDLSTVVSKYIGETEKNLRQLFDAAEDGGVILFFDEADALFGKRSEVKDSHDRYANIEINYLLQRIEAYSGLAILATNMKEGLDTAFLRRLRFVVDFPFPGVAQRRRIWQKALPQGVPGRESLDYDWLAKLTITGGSIHNIALNASFIAAEQDDALTMPIVLTAARIEYEKMQQPINENLFQWHRANGVYHD